jgi:hypothetical protein
MNTQSKAHAAPSIEGHMISLGAGHSIAIHERNGEGFVAEFRDGRAELMHAGNWFRFHAGGLRYCHNRRTAFQSSMPLTPEMLEKIERLHRESEARQAMMLAVPRNAARTVQEFCIGVMSRLRGRAASVNSLPADR